RQFAPTFTLDPVIGEEELEPEVRRVGQAVGFLSRGRLQGAVSAFSVAPPQSYATWAKEVRRLATRAALLIADDLGSTLKAVGEEVGPDNYASDLVRFWVSDPAMRFRRALHR
ncbi:MAG: hypothetical protein AB8I08_40410, partial [Sandaracinaceae bacterium]